MASNGVIHIVKTLLYPAGKSRDHLSCNRGLGWRSSVWQQLLHCWLRFQKCVKLGQLPHLSRVSYYLWIFAKREATAPFPTWQTYQLGERTYYCSWKDSSSTSRLRYQRPSLYMPVVFNPKVIMQCSPGALSLHTQYVAGYTYHEIPLTFISKSTAMFSATSSVIMEVTWCTSLSFRDD